MYHFESFCEYTHQRTLQSQQVDSLKRRFELVKNDWLITNSELDESNERPCLQPIIHLDNLTLKVARQKLKFAIYACNGDLRNCIKSSEKFKELYRDALESFEELVEQDMCQENLYLEICTTLKEQIDLISTGLEIQIKYYKRRC